MKIIVAKNLFSKVAGLIAKKEIKKEDVYVIPDCRRVHTWFMRFPIDVIFLDQDKKILAVEENIGPWRLSKCVERACDCAEAASGFVKANKIKVGDLFSSY